MNALSADPKIIAIANALGLRGGDAVENILEYCRKKVGDVLRHTAVRTIAEVERIICEHLNLVIHEVRNDGDIRSIIQKYAVEEGDTVFAALAVQLENAFGVLIQRRPLHAKDPFRYVAVVDTRGDKASRCFFTRWHEIAHCLTVVQQFELPLHRSPMDKDPCERLMDIIAGDIGFFAPLFCPILEHEIGYCGDLTFSIVEKIRAEFCPDASFQATLNACLVRLKTPAIVIETGLGFKRAEKRALNNPQIPLIPAPYPVASLRVLSTVANDGARKVGLYIHKNMRVPVSSIIFRVFQDHTQSGALLENLASWTSSDGDSLPAREVTVRARKFGDHVLAILTPASSQSARPESHALSTGR